MGVLGGSVKAILLLPELIPLSARMPRKWCLGQQRAPTQHTHCRTGGPIGNGAWASRGRPHNIPTAGGEAHVLSGLEGPQPTSTEISSRGPLHLQAWSFTPGPLLSSPMPPPPNPIPCSCRPVICFSSSNGFTSSLCSPFLQSSFFSFPPPPFTSLFHSHLLFQDT